MAGTIQTPALTGTEAQVQWAERIRADTLRGVEHAIGQIPQYVEVGRITTEQADAMRTALESWRDGVLRQAEAKWWIEKRSRLQGFGLIQELGAVAEKAYNG